MPQDLVMNFAASHTHSASTTTPASQSNPSVAYQTFLFEQIAATNADANQLWCEGEFSSEIWLGDRE
ncbi:MAG: hypothetical protein AAF585_11510 [Verrucomicrobiota bacterium]